MLLDDYKKLSTHIKASSNQILVGIVGSNYEEKKVGIKCFLTNKRNELITLDCSIIYSNRLQKIHGNRIPHFCCIESLKL
jgi:hypothetical protein